MKNMVKTTKKPKWGAGWTPHMKMKKSHYIRLEQEINLILDRYPGAYKTYQQKGLTNTRFNWDLFWMTTKKAKALQYGIWNYNDLDYLQDEHINTALQKITGKTGKLR